MEEDDVNPPKMGPEEQRAFQQSTELLQGSDARSLSLDAVPTLVSLRDVVEDPPSMEDEVLSGLVVPSRAAHALFRSLEKLEALELDPVLDLEREAISGITRLVTGATSQEEVDAVGGPLKALEILGASIPRRVCQHPFRKNDIVWVCRTCQSDETCVLCHQCFTQSQHEGHDVAFYHAQAGGCCDCGDPDAWDPAGFCPHHGPSSQSGQGLSTEVIHRVRGVVPACGEWLVSTIADKALIAHKRTVAHKTLSRSESMPIDRTSTAAALPPPTRQHSMGTDPDRGNDSGDISDIDNELPDDIDEMVLDHGLVFSPQAASTSKSRHGESLGGGQTPTMSQKLGDAGREGHGLYLVLHADDIHTTTPLVDALREVLGPSSFSDSILGRVVRSLRQHGQLVVWGTMELMAECSKNMASLWLDGDNVASERIGAMMLDRANRLVKHGLVCSIHTRREIYEEQRAVSVLKWMTALARSCDPLCQTVAESLRSQAHLVPMLRADFQLGASITKSWHSLLLTLLAVPIFKSRLAAAYCDTYRHVTSEYARGLGVLERSAYTLSVQFLNRVTYVVGLVQGRDLLGKLGKSLLETLSVATKKSRGSNKVLPRLNPNHFVLTHRRYSPCISDLKCVLNVKGMSRLFASTGGTFLQDWTLALSLAQYMDGQVWRSWSQGHVEVEPRGWVGAFNASISLGSLFERLLSWDDDDQSPIDPSTSPLASTMQSCVSLTSSVMADALSTWQLSEMLSYRSTANTAAIEPHRRCPASLPFSTAARNHGAALAMRALPIAQVTSWSFHLPLHRFVASCLREACRRSQDFYVEDVLTALRQIMSETNHDALFRGLMEFPVIVLTRSAQIRAGLWKRNGPGMHDQVLNYAEPPFCRVLRDADLLLVQFSVLGRTLHQSPTKGGESDVGCCFLVNLLLHRLGLFEFVGLGKAPNSDFSRYAEEVEAGLYQGEQCIDRGGDDNDDAEVQLVLPWTYSPAKDTPSLIALLEEFLHILIVLITELPSVPPIDKAEHTLQAKRRLRREVVHRLASGPKTHSELTEVHHVLSHWDNVCLSEEGKMLNPDDATGAALETVLAEVADRKLGRGRLAPDHWELRRSAWDSYDPSFFHMSQRSHQGAAENRPSPKASASPPLFGVEAQPYVPRMSAAHAAFQRLRRDVTADSSVLAVAYRTLHVHCRNVAVSRDMSELRGRHAYENDAMSETVLARSVHLLTLGAFAWQNVNTNDDASSWKQRGGGSVGSVFYSCDNSAAPPTAQEWIEAALLANPRDLVDDDWYTGEENALLLLQRLAVDGGSTSVFVAQDGALRAGAAWLCDFAVKNNPRAARLIGAQTSTNADSDQKESDKERRRREAKARAMSKMKAEAARFAAMMQIDAEDGSDDAENDTLDASEAEVSPRTPLRLRSMSSSSAHGSDMSLPSTTSAASPARSETSSVSPRVATSDLTSYEENQIPERLLSQRPQCIICVEENGAGNRRTESDMSREEEESGHRKRTRRKSDGSNALGFVGYAQASAVLKGGGGPPPKSDSTSPLSVVRRFVGSHVTLCGHAVHSQCCESYLLSQREDRSTGRKEEFRCPLCQRLSNCLVPFIDVGIDWIDQPTCLPVSQDSHTDPAEAKPKLCDFKSRYDDNTNVCDELHKVALHQFLSTTPWWVSRNDETVVWDGRCAFVEIQESPTHAADSADQCEDSKMHISSPSGENSEQEMNGNLNPAKAMRRRSVRSLRKKDLYSAWNAMMRTPRFMRRKNRLKKTNEQVHGGATSTADGTSGGVPQWLHVADDSSGETVVWRRLMDLIADVAYRADGKRLGEERFHSFFGEFRHYQVEKYAYNAYNRAEGKESADWPLCISSSTISESRRQELSREKALSKLLMAVQSLTYSLCSESSEARRLLRKLNIPCGEPDDMDSDTNSVKDLYSKFGVSGVSCNGMLLLMPIPSTTEDEGGQPFNGRLGKLRYLALAVMAAAGAVSADLVQLVLSFPLHNRSLHDNAHLRAPIVYPILYGHVLTHVVAAICAACGRARARSDFLEFAWPLPFSRGGSFCGVTEESGSIDSVLKDCEGFVMLGLLARLSQVLLGSLGFGPGGKHWDNRHETGPLLLAILKQHHRKEESQADDDDGEVHEEWSQSCVALLEVVLQGESTSSVGDSKLPSEANQWIKQFSEACSVAADAACSYLADSAIIVQILVPGAASKYALPDAVQGDRPMSESVRTFGTFEKLRKRFGFEPLHTMLQSDLVVEVVTSWCRDASEYSVNEETASAADTPESSLKAHLLMVEGFRVLDWPMESARELLNDGGLKLSLLDVPAEPHDEVTAMEIDTFSSRTRSPESASAFPSYSPKKLVPLIGGYCDCGEDNLEGRLRSAISMLPTSYTDLYAELGTLCPDSDQIGLCLICGEVLNAGGKGECTQHSFKCGAGTGVFFLLQECVGLIMHIGKAAYVHSPYVDSHGETPQYRGRPLNLDLDRYNILHEMWSGHTVRQKVIAERGSSRQVIIADFY